MQYKASPHLAISWFRVTIQNLQVSSNNGLRTGHFKAVHTLLKKNAALRLSHPDAWQGKGEESTVSRMHCGQTPQEQVTSVKLRAATTCLILLSSS